LTNKKAGKPVFFIEELSYERLIPSASLPSLDPHLMELMSRCPAASPTTTIL